MSPIHALAEEIRTLSGRINAANHRFLTLIAEFDRRNGWAVDGAQSCAHWLNWQCGVAMGAAREKVRVARALEKLPKVADAMSSGRLSYSKAREITRVGHEHNEDYLLSIAEHGTAAHVERLVRAYRRCQEAEEMSREKRQQQNRRVTFRCDDDGSLVLTCHLPAETARRFSCDASIASIIEDTDGEPLDAGRRTRNISAPLRRLLTARDKGCRFPGCANARYIDMHHIKHWANGGETNPSNLVSLCRFHHRAVHEGGFEVRVLDDGAIRFVRPDGRPVVREAPDCVRTAGAWWDVPKATGDWKYRGDRMDLGTAVDLLIQCDRKARDVPAGTPGELRHC